jgi:hypothetical protein
MKYSTDRKEILYQGSFLVILVVLNYRLFHTWFIVDDTANIFCSSFDTLRLLFDRYTYLYSNQMFFTPLMPISFKVDWLLFKMDPFGYHLHNLLAAFLCCIMFYKLLRIYLPAAFSWIGALLLACSLPVSFDIGWITRKQYLWGFFLALLALYLFKKWEMQKKNLFLFLSITTTLFSYLCKEAYTFLPAVIFLAASGSIKNRTVKTLPYMFVLIVYIIWRLFMLGSLGGYPGSTDRSILYFMQRLFQIPMDLSESLYGFPFLPFILLAITAFLNVRILVLSASLFLVVISPFIFYPEGGFLLANKALSFVAVVSFSLSYILSALYSKQKKLLFTLFLLLLLPILYGSTAKIMNGQKVIMRLSEQYERASHEIIESGNQKILVVGNFAYYFSNLEDIYRNMLQTDFPYIRSLSSPAALPYLERNDFDKILLLKNLDLSPDTVSATATEVLTGSEAKQYLAENLAINGSIPPPEVKFIPMGNRLKIEITDARSGTYLRCLYMGSYVGCYPIPNHYIFQYNGVKKIRKIDIIYASGDGKTSQPATFRP